MQEIIGLVTKELINIIDTKKNPKKVAWQFILEELDAARECPIKFVQKRIETFYIRDKEYISAMENSWSDVDGPDGPQQYLILVTTALSKKIDMEMVAMVRITVVEYLIAHYKYGRYSTKNRKLSNLKELDLFKVIVPKEKLHRHFCHLMKDSHSLARSVIRNWSSGFLDRDNKLIFEFQTTFNSTFWELYLHQAFKDLGMTIDFSNQSPDFTVKTKNNNMLNIEAVIASNAYDSIPESEGTMRDLKEEPEFLKFSCIRILNALTSKYFKYQSSYSNFTHVKGNPYIIAIAPFEQPGFFMQNNEAIIRVLYGQGIKTTLLPDGEFESEEEFVPYILKENGAKLELGIFTNDKFKEVSAVIFSTMATISKAVVQTDMEHDIKVSRYDSEIGLLADIIPNRDHYETHLDGLQIHHNPFAITPLDPEDFAQYEVTHYFYDPITQIIDNQQRNYTMISRSSSYILEPDE